MYHWPLYHAKTSFSMIACYSWMASALDLDLRWHADQVHRLHLAHASKSFAFSTKSLASVIAEYDDLGPRLNLPIIL